MLSAGPVKIETGNAGKKFGKDWIFRHADLLLETGRSYAILGNNGSGKSTFLMSIAGFYALSEGRVRYCRNGKEINEWEWYRHYALISPLLELPEDFTMNEFLDFHFALKPVKQGWSKERLYAETGLSGAENKLLKQLSSGMKQRIKLAMAFMTDVPVVLLDEPCTNLDRPGIRWYRELAGNAQDQLLVVASNMEEEYDFCDQRLEMGAFKRK
jgi:ABC-type multidrug transport system ATPase subunit